MVTIEKSSGNLYADLGSRDADAMLLKAQLAMRIAALMKKQALTQVQAAALFGMPQPKVSALLRGQFRGISEEKMMRCLLALGQDVRIVVKPARAGRRGGLSVGA